MIYVDGELLNTRNKTQDYEHSELVAAYHKRIAALREQFGDVLRVQTRQKMRIDNKTNFPRYPATKGLILQAHVATEEGIIQFTYSPSILQKKKGKLILDPPNFLVQRGETFIDVKRNPDFAFYCTHTGVVAMNEDIPKGKFHVVDLTKIDKERAAKLRLEGRLANLIFSAIPENNLRTLAKSWGIRDVEVNPLDTVRVELHNKVLKNESAKQKGAPGKFRGTQEFIDSSEVKIYDQVAALVADASDQKALIYNNVDRRWEIDYADNTTPYILKELAAGEFANPTESLVRFLVSENEKLRKLERAIGKAIEHKEVERKADITPPVSDEFPTAEEILGAKGIPPLKKWIKLYVPEFKQSNTDKAAKLKELLMAKLAERAEVQE